MSNEALTLTEAHQLLTTSEAASLLAVRDSQLTLWRRKGRGPKFIRLTSSTVRYRMADLIEYQDSCLSGGVA